MKIVFLKNHNSLSVYSQLLIVAFLFLTIWDIPVLTGRVTEFQSLNYIIGAIFIHISIIYIFYIWIVKVKKVYRQITIKIRNNLFVLLPIIVFILINMENFTVLFKGDSFVYYNNFISKLDSWNYTLNNIRVFEMAGHKSYAYSILLYMGYCIFPNAQLGIHFINMILGIITLCCVYAIIRIISSDLNRIAAALITTVFAVMPIYGGIFYYFNLDFAVCTFFAVLIFCYIYQLKILQLLCCLALCFSKETGIIICAFFLSGVWAARCVDEYQRGEKKSRKKIVKYITLWPWISSIPVCAGLLAILLSDSGWGKVGKQLLKGVEDTKITKSKIFFDLDFIFYKFQQMNIIHYSWIISLIIAVCLCTFIYRKLKDKGSYHMNANLLIVILFSYAGFLLFNFLYLTYMHYRYIQIQAFFQIVFLSYALSVFSKKKKYLYYVVIPLLIILFSECYVTSDPVTLFELPKVYTGNTYTASTRRIADIGEFVLGTEKQLKNQFLNEGLINNRQQLGIESGIEKCLGIINYEEDDLIVLPKIYGDFTARSILGGETYDNYYWDSRTEQMTVYETDNPINFCYDDELKNQQLNDIKNIYYLIMPFTTSYDYFQNIRKEDIDILREVNSRTWKIILSRVDRGRIGEQ